MDISPVFFTFWLTSLPKTTYFENSGFDNCAAGTWLCTVRAIILYNLKFGYRSSPLALYSTFRPLSSFTHSATSAIIGSFFNNFDTDAMSFIK